MRRDNTYSRVIAWLKILLPMAALALLSTVFLFSKDTSNLGDLPFAEADLRDRASNQQVTAPRFSGTTARGETIELMADAARPSPGSDDGAEARKIILTLDTTAQGEITAQAENVQVTFSEQTATLTGGVIIDSSTGYHVETASMKTALNRIYAESLAPVSGIGPLGKLEAGHFLVETSEKGGIQLLFTKGVKLIYEPKINRE